MALLLARVFDDAAGARFPFAGLHDVEIVVRVDPDAVARAVDRAAPGGQALAVEVEDADHPGIVLGDIDDVVVVDIEERHPDQLGRPHRQQFAALVEHLDPVVLAVGDQHPAAAVDPHPVRQVELSRCGAGLPPREQVFGISGELWTRALP